PFFDPSIARDLAAIPNPAYVWQIPASEYGRFGIRDADSPPPGYGPACDCNAGKKYTGRLRDCAAEGADPILVNREGDT
ncbi:MAG: hypothetical protein QME32_08555, partial [Endomicrobiia bacterium]|nr:hypothetical protein [Endomicrobiia bacterium]